MNKKWLDVKKVSKLWCENFYEGGLRLFQGVRLFQSLEYLNLPVPTLHFLKFGVASSGGADTTQK